MSNKAYPIKEFSCPPLKEKYYLYRHPSGLDIYIFPKKMTSAYAFFGTRFGSVDNTFKTDKNADFVTVPDGIAHFLEHKLFSNEDGSDSFERFSEYGADANAYTSFNRTTYYFGCTENFDVSLEELITFVTHPYFTEETVAKEIGIIEEEIKMYEDNPSDRCYYGMLDGLYEKHSVKRNICGSPDSIRKITPQLLYDCYRVFYSLSNMVLAVCGDIEPERIIKIADAVLPSEADRTEIIRSNENLSEKKEAARPYTEQKMNVARPLFYIGIKDTDIPDTPEGIIKKDVLMMILNDMLFSECTDFYNELLDSEIIYPSLRYGYSVCESFAYNSLSGTADDPKLVLRKLLSYIDTLKEKGLDKEAFIRAKRVMYAEFVKLFDSTEGIANQLFSYACDGSDIFMNHELISSVTFEETEALFKRAFSKEYITLSAVFPNDSGKK